MPFDSRTTKTNKICLQRDFLNFNANCVFCVSARDFSPRFTTLYAVLLRRARNGKAFWNFSQAGDAVGMFHGWPPPDVLPSEIRV